MGISSQGYSVVGLKRPSTSTGGQLRAQRDPGCNSNLSSKGMWQNGCTRESQLMCQGMRESHTSAQGKREDYTLCSREKGVISNMPRDEGES